MCDISRESEDPASEFTVGFVLGPQAPDGVVGLGLGGVEAGFPPELFASSFARARVNGLAALPHAGETAGPDSIWGAVRTLTFAARGHVYDEDNAPAADVVIVLGTGVLPDGQPSYRLAGRLETARSDPGAGYPD